MTKERLKQLKYMEIALKEIRRDITLLERKIGRASEKTFTGRGKGSMNVFPYIEVSYELECCDNTARDRLLRELKARELDLEEELLNLEQWLKEIKDPKLYSIFKMTYKDEMSDSEIGKVLGYHKSRISQLRNDYLKES